MHGPPARLAAALAALALLGAAGCGGGDRGAAGGAAPGAFDAARALADVRMQVEIGPRPAGSEASRRLARRLRDALPEGRLEPLPGGLANVVGRLPGEGRPVLVGAHYDTLDLPGFVGANDGAAGTAVVLELARALPHGRRACEREIRLVLFDGEEAPHDSDDFLRDGLRGSTAYAARHAGELEAVIVVDFVGNEGLRLPREAGSDARLWQRLRAAAARVGAAGAFPDEVRAVVLDDHTPFARAGVPAIVLIDFTYPHFHRLTDTLDKISRRSLDLVGRSLLELLRELSGETCSPGD